uniref:probable WRKY transcription factor 27 n=1 Tax=Erigeron canadensis TaxID=72917 RepID=UPI001CB95825|nr:probable WRKY transcription factor 27 [Erigeron canadensis]
MENTSWSLQAMISRRPNNKEQHDDGYGCIDIKKEYDQALLFCYPHLSDFDSHDDHNNATISIKNEVVNNINGSPSDEFLLLDQLYKPAAAYYNFPVGYGTGTESEYSPPAAPTPPAADLHHHQEYSDDQEVIQQQDINNFCGSTAASNNYISQVAPKLKKRKNQQKRVVVQVTADGLSSDPWAWRKYGQKPIKGSIYPRSYYRCSTSKGCLARRQVEQSCDDSNIYILTYTADHNHAQPTRRNSLAGINRNRFKAPTPKSPASIPNSKDSPSHSPTATHNSSANSSIDDEVVLLQQSSIKQETTTTFYNNNYDDGYQMMEAGINNDDCMFFSDDFFEGLEDLGGYKMESSSSSNYNNFSSSNNKQQFPCLFS